MSSHGCPLGDCPVCRQNEPGRNVVKLSAKPASPRAAELPDGTVVARRNAVWMKDRSPGFSRWLRLGGGDLFDGEVDKALATGARVLRYGYDGGSDDD